MVNVDYANDFKGNLHYPEYSYHTNYFLMRVQCLCETLCDLTLMMGVIIVCSFMVKRMIYQMFEQT